MNNTDLTKDDILSFLKQQEATLREKFHVQKIGLFGSYAIDKANEKSDVDLLVDFEEGNLDYYSIKRDLHDYLVVKLNREIDIAIRKSLKPFFRDTILKQAVYA